MERITGIVQHYAWGDPDAIPSLLGVEPDGRPWAELWLGTHSGGPSAAGVRPLSAVSGELPYLLKVLAAAEPLSLQTHPTAERAADGFAAEDEAGIALDAAERIYKDANPKPELICALTEFDALCGFRPVDATIALLDSMGATQLSAHLAGHGLRDTVAALYRGELSLDETLAACIGRPQREAALVAELAGAYPGDPSVVVTLLLNRVALEPGDAIFLSAGNLHAYLHGVGIEIMQASDNVVRGGLTVKHVDVEALLDVLDYTTLADPLVRPMQAGPGAWRYDTPGTPFRLWRIEIDGEREHVADGRELLLCTAGDVGPLARGQTLYLDPDDVLQLSGRGTLFRVEERALSAAG